MRRRLAPAVLGSLCAVLAVAGCGKETTVREPDLVVRGEPGAEPPAVVPDQVGRGLRITSTRIAVVTHGQASDPIWGVVKRGIEDARRRENVGVSYRAPDTYDVAVMRRMVRDAIADHPDGLVVSLPDATALGPAIRAARRDGIPVVTINSGSDAFRRLGVEAHVGQPEYAAGFEGGVRLARAGARRVVCVDHEAGNHGLAERCRGLGAALRARGGSARRLTIDLQDPVDAQREIAATIAGGDVDGLMTLGPVGAVPALAALRAGGFEGRVRLATFDLSPEVLAAVAGGRILFAIDQQPYLQGYLPVVLLAERARHGIFPTAGGLIPTGPRFVTRANVDAAIRANHDGVR